MSLNLALKRAEIKSEETVSINRRLLSRLFILVGWVVGLMGLFISFIGFRRWYKHLQQFQDRLLLKEAEAKLSTATVNEQNEQDQPNEQTQVNVPEPN